MPICPDCSHYSADFAQGRLDPQDGTWYCASCWIRFDQEEKKERLKLGYLLPEDRVVWYSPGSVISASNSSSLWCHEGSLVVEVLDPVEGVKQNSWRLDLVEDFYVCGQSPAHSLVIYGSSLPIVSINEVFPSSHLAFDNRYGNARKLVKISRQERKLLRSMESRAKAKAAAEVEAKKRELLEIAKRRAQLKKKPGKLQLIKKKVETWKSEHLELIKLFPIRSSISTIHDVFQGSPQLNEPPVKRPRLDSPQLS